jgi:hypothetical protein
MKIKTIKAIIFLITIPLYVVGQNIPAIKLDSSVNTSQFYSWTYEVERSRSGNVLAYWFLDQDFKLYSGRPSHHPPANAKFLVGSWNIEKDSIVMHISKPKKLGLVEPVDYKYRAFQLTWSTNTGFTEKDTGEPLIVTSICIILSADPTFKATRVLADLNKYIETYFALTGLKDEKESLGAWDDHERVDNLVREYFSREKIVVGIKQYRNQNLWVR